jgi:hypothetical protein
LIWQLGFLVFQASTSMSTICLLPPERSHMVSSPLLAQLVVAAGAWAVVDGVSPSWLQAATIRVATPTRTSHRRLLIPRSSMSSSPGLTGRSGAYRTTRIRDDTR